VIFEPRDESDGTTRADQRWAQPIPHATLIPSTSLTGTATPQRAQPQLKATTDDNGDQRPAATTATPATTRSTQPNCDSTTKRRARHPQRVQPRLSQADATGEEFKLQVSTLFLLDAP
jgi:hypothetical protein